MVAEVTLLKARLVIEAGFWYAKHVKKIFISYKFTGEVLEELQNNMNQLCRAFRDKGYEVFCSIESEGMYRKDKYTVTQMMTHALGELDKADLVFVFNNSDNRSEGMLIEMGYAFAKNKPIILAARKGININSSKGISAKLIEFETLEDLLPQIESLSI